MIAVNVKEDDLAVLFSFKKLQWPADLRNKMEKCTRKIISGLSPAQVLGQISTLRRIVSAISSCTIPESFRLQKIKIRENNKNPNFLPKKICFFIKQRIFLNESNGFFFPFFCCASFHFGEMFENFYKFERCLKGKYFVTLFHIKSIFNISDQTRKLLDTI